MKGKDLPRKKRLTFTKLKRNYKRSKQSLQGCKESKGKRKPPSNVWPKLTTMITITLPMAPPTRTTAPLTLKPKSKVKGKTPSQA